MSSLNTQTKYVSMILTRINSLDLEQLKSWLNENCDIWSFIIHNRDFYENGLLKDKHIHVVCEMKNSRQRLATTLSRISDALKLPSISISVQKTQSTEGALQYLIHKNDKDKASYEYSEIVTNMPKDDLINYLSAENLCLSIDRLITVCKESIELKSKMYIIKSIGLGYYSKYRNVINDIIEELMAEKRNKKLVDQINKNCK